MENRSLKATRVLLPKWYIWRGDTGMFTSSFTNDVKY